VTDDVSPGTILGLLGESRRREKRQALFYRHLAAEAERARMLQDAERLNELHADEQHHLSRLTARLLELGGVPEDLRGVEPPPPAPTDWEAVAREREDEEVRWYEERLAAEIDDRTRALLEEVLESERKHRDRLGGKWMSA
jgi:rubrerythrin